MLQTIKSDFLEAFPFFQASAPEVIDGIVNAVRPQTISSEQPVFRVGDSCGVIAFLLSGRLRVYTTGASGRELTLYEVARGQVCILNIACILSNQAYPALATVVQDGSALIMSSADFKRLVDGYPDMRSFAFSGLGSRLLTMIRLVEEIAFRKLDERLHEYIAKKSEDGILTATHQKIANELGTSREIISRVLEDMEQRGMIKLTRNRITVMRL